jgi:ribosomal protein S18 acetylase RimI-like enzyme
MNPGIIRRINHVDLPKVVELERKCFKNLLAYSPDQLKYLITKANSNCLGECISETLRGFIIVLFKKGTKVAGIETLNVDPIYHGNGIGKKLLIAAEEDMKIRGINKINLEVSTKNIPAIKLYEKFGYKKENILKNYYKYEHFGTYNAYKMIKNLAE